MAEQSNQPRTGTSPSHQAETGGVVAQKTGQLFKGHVVVLPFTVKELLDHYNTLPSADAREDFWQMLKEEVAKWDDEQKTLFSLSWAQSLAETVVQSDKTIAEIDALLAQHNAA